MRIVFTVEFYYPHKGGAEYVVQTLAEGLARRGHDTTVVTSVDANRDGDHLNKVRICEFAISGNRVKGMRGNCGAYVDFLAECQCDVFVNYAAQSWPTDLAFDHLERIHAVKVLMPCGYSGLAMLSKRPFYWTYFRRLPGYLRRYDHIVYHSGNYIDKVFGDRHGIASYSVIPNGVSLGEMENAGVDFRRIYGIDTPYMLLSVSNHWRLKNHGFVIDAFQKLRRNDVTLVIIGDAVAGRRGCFRACEKAARRSTRPIRLISSAERKHTVAAFRQADLFVLGSRVECFPLVLLEAMASRTAFVATPVGAIQDFAGGVTATTPAEMSQSITHLLDNEGLRLHLAEAGYRQCVSRYNWDAILNSYEDLFGNLVARRSG